MLTMKIELWPFGDEAYRKRLVTINLANMGQSLEGEGHDYVWTIDEPKPLHGEPIAERGRLTNYDRNATCVDILDAILTDYKFRGGQPELTEYERDTCDILRRKTNAENIENRFPY